MGTAQSTPLLDLPIFGDDDRPTWRGDVTGAFNKIDSSYGTLTGSINNNALDISDIKSQIPIAPPPTGADDTVSLNAFFTTNSGKHVQLRQGANYSVNGTLATSNNLRVDLNGATVTQTSANKIPLFDATGNVGVSIINGTLIGNASVYDDTATVYPACALRAGAGANKISLINCNVYGFAGPAMYGSAANNLTMRDCYVVGVGNGGGYGTFTFATSVSKDNAAFITDNNCSRVWVVDNDMSYLAQGVLGGSQNVDYHVSGNTIHDIGGQHGIYLNYGARIDVIGNIVRNCAASGIKVQTQSGAPDCLGVNITGNIVETVAANGIIVTCASNLVPSRHRDVNVSGNVIRNSANDGVVVEYVVGAIVADNIIFNARAGIRVSDFSGVSVSGNRVYGCQNQGISVSSLTFACNDIIISDNAIRDCGQAGSPASNFGVHIAESSGAITNVAMNDVNITDTTGKIRYGIYVVVATSSYATYSMRNVVGNGFTDYGHRGPAGNMLSIVNNNLYGNLGAWYSTPANGTLGNPLVDTYSTTGAPPTSGTFVRGQRCINIGATSGQPSGWQVTTGGTDAAVVWSSLGNLS